jgi:hypothetical protein
MTLVLDIETVPLDDALAAPYPAETRQPPANYKSEDAIGKWRVSDRAAWETNRAKECSLNPRLGRILCLGTSEGTILAPTVDEEPALLRQAWEWLHAHAGQVVTWNGTWDLRFILIRSLHHNVIPQVPGSVINQWFRKYSYAPHFDVKAALMNWEIRAGEGLGEWCRFLSVEGKTEGLSGADVWPLYQAGQLDEIAAYCAQDVQATLNVYRLVQPFFASI